MNRKDFRPSNVTSKGISDKDRQTIRHIANDDRNNMIVGQRDNLLEISEKKYVKRNPYDVEYYEYVAGSNNKMTKKKIKPSTSLKDAESWKSSIEKDKNIVPNSVKIIKNKENKSDTESKNEIIKQGDKYGILSTFEIGNSGEYEQRVVVSGLSKSKAEKLKSGMDDKSIYTTKLDNDEIGRAHV